MIRPQFFHRDGSGTEFAYAFKLKSVSHDDTGAFCHPLNRIVSYVPRILNETGGVLW